jgi:hypothetical protein
MKMAFTVMTAVLLLAPAVAAADLPKPLLDAYLQIQAALAADTSDGVATQAATIVTAAASLGAEAERLATAAKKLEAAKDIGAARTAFGEVSEALIAYAEKSKSSLGADVNIAFCPMANKPWLQKEKAIRNPYYGKSMISCGSFRTKK